MPADEYQPVEDDEVAEDHWDDDSELELDSDDEVDDGKGGKKKRELGAWKANLKHLVTTQETIPEDELHIVRWNVVIINFVLYCGTVGLFMGFVFMCHLSALLLLPYFLATFVLGVICLEMVHASRLQEQAKVYSSVLLVAGIGVLTLGPFDTAKAAASIAIVPFGAAVLYFYRKESDKNLLEGGYLNSSRLWQALSGRKTVVVWEELDLAALARSIRYNGREVARCRKADFNVCKLGLVSIDDSQEIPDIPLVVDAEPVPPDQYKIVDIKHVLDSDKVDVVEGGILQDLNSMVTRRKYISDKVLDSWVNPDRKGTMTANQSTQDKAKGGKSAETSVQTWFQKVSLAPQGASALIVDLARINYMEGLSDHWALRAAWVTMYCCLLALPTAHVFMQMDFYRREVCNVGGLEGEALHPKGKQFVGDMVICDGDLSDGSESCAVVCATLLNFIAAVHDRWQTSYVELSIVMVLLPISVFTACVRQARQQHTVTVLEFLSRMRQPKNVVTEVSKIKRIFEDILNFDFLWNRFIGALKAWRGSDDSLCACGPITEAEFDLTATKGVNDCFRRVMEPVSLLATALSCDRADSLPYGIGCIVEKLPEPGTDVYTMEDAGEVCTEVKDQWQSLKYRNELGGASIRNYKVLVDLVMYSDDSWKLFEKFLKTEYSEQLKYITDAERLDVPAQDSGMNTHLTANKSVYDILLPKGFSLSHIYVANMPEDGKPYQIVVTSHPKGITRFWEHCHQLRELIRKANVDDEDYDPGSGESLLDHRLSTTPIIARFALSEQYYENMSLADVKALCPEFAEYVINKPSFTEFVDACLKPEVFVVPKELEEGEQNYTYFMGLSVFMGDQHPAKALIAAAKRCFHSIAVYVQCIFLAMLIPCLRQFSGGQLFPMPFFVWMVFNTISIWYQLVCFFADFHVARTRLGLVNDCLTLLATNTNRPPTRGGEAAGVKKSKKVRRKQTQEAEATAKSAEEQKQAEVKAAKEQEEDTRPFDLVVAEVHRDYDPADEFWSESWHRAHDKIRNWHLTVSYLRVFVSTSRLTAQTMLAAAVVVLGFLCAVSFVQAAVKSHVSSMPSVHEALKQAHEHGYHHSRRLRSEINEAMEALVDERWAGAYHSMSAEDAYRREVAEPDSLQAAARELRASLEPLHRDLGHALRLQGKALQEGHGHAQDKALPPVLESTLHATHRRLVEKEGFSMKAAEEKAAKLVAAMDVTKATKTQLFTVFMVVFVMMYSIPLMWNIVLVNGHFDIHEDLLIKQQEEHRTLQNKREFKRKEKAAVVVASSAEKQDATASASEVADVAPAPVVAVGNVESKDPHCSRYERVLSMAIKASRKSRERFPFTLFGFVISFQLLASWIALAIAPICSEVQKIMPAVTLMSCSWLEHSKLTESLQQQVDLNNPGLHMNVTKMIHINLCVPMQQWVEASAATGLKSVTVQAHIASANAKLKQLADAKSNVALGVGRRLGDADLYFGEDDDEVTSPTLRHLVLSWWQKHPSLHPEAKYAAAQLMLHELEREGHRLLLDGPAAVLQTFESDKEVGGGAKHAFASARYLLEHQIALTTHSENEFGNQDYRRDLAEL